MLTIIIIGAVTLLAVSGFTVVRSASHDINNDY